jgi:hypothetical protein
MFIEFLQVPSTLQLLLVSHCPVQVEATFLVLQFIDNVYIILLFSNNL